MNIVSGVYWDKGGRQKNQDSLILEQVLTGKGRVVLAAVCDGIGGLAEGEIAGGFACERLRKCFYQEILPLLSKKRGRQPVARCLCRCLYEAGADLGKYADSKSIGMGTTVSVLLLWHNRYLTIHLGDSRIYALQGKKKIRQLTVDHRKEGNILTKCLGSFGFQTPDIRSGRVGRGTGFLLCSDGFYHYPGEQLLAEVLNPKEIGGGRESVEKRLKELAAYGQKRGEQDNMSAVYLLCRQGR